ncbi:MAG: bifunctional nuclease family protein [Deltaproteobacteria bacterium]|jgi:bifunctional DNase/RNase|nr:bifunctional nuclease family protein [Deltaproteobacteria bacterium]
MRVLGLTLDETSHAPILLLQEEAGRELLPIWIGPLEAMAISVVLGKLPMERPLTHDLCLNVLHSLKARLSGVELVDVREGTYYAELVLLRENGETYRLDCRPSDAVALALRAPAPIRASKALLRRAADLQSASEASGAYAPVSIHKLVVKLHADQEGGYASAGFSAEQDRFSELLRALEPESKRKM